MPSRSRSFTAIATPRLDAVAAELGFEPLGRLQYVRRRDDWVEMVAVACAGHGNAFFYVDYGIAMPALCPEAPVENLTDAAFLLWERLRDADGSGGFGCTDAAEIAASIERVQLQLEVEALPWFSARGSREVIAADYLWVNPIEEARLGRHGAEFGEDLRSATYGWLLLHAGRVDDARRWLQESRRLLTRPGRREPYELDCLQRVETTLSRLAGDLVPEVEA